MICDLSYLPKNGYNMWLEGYLWVNPTNLIALKWVKLGDEYYKI